MDTTKFELTSEERSQVIQRDTTLWCPTKGEFLDEVGEVIAKAQVAKILSMFEPVELEVLEDDEMKRIINLNKQMGNRHFYEAGKRLVQATIQKNQKEQLYKVKVTK